MRTVILLVVFLLGMTLTACGVLLSRAGVPAALKARVTTAACRELRDLETSARKADASLPSELLARARLAHCGRDPEPCGCLMNYDGPDLGY